MSKKITIGLCGIADFRSSIGQGLLNGVYDACSKHNLNIINFCGSTKYSVSEDYELYKYYPKIFQYLNGKNIDGLITWASSFTPFLSSDDLIRIHNSLAPLPMVALGIPILPDIPGVYTNVENSISLLMDHLVEDRGYMRIAFIGSKNRSHYMVRLQKYKDWLIRHNLPVDEELIFLTEKLHAEDLAESLQNLIDLRKKRGPQFVDAVMTVSDIVANEIIDKFQAQGIRVPEDIAVTGYNNQFESIIASVPITTVELQFYEKGVCAVEFLMEQIKNPELRDVDKSIFYPSRLIIRQSTGLYEEGVMSAGKKYQRVGFEEVSSEKSGLKERILEAMSLQTSELGVPVNKALVDALLLDLEQENGTSLLSCMRANYSLSSSHSDNYINHWQNAISIMRNIILNYCDLSPETAANLENLFHQARILISVFNSYYLTSKRHDAYAFHYIAQIAIDLSTVSDGNHTMRLLSRHVESLGMPSFILILQDELYSDLGIGRITMEYPLNNRAIIVDDYQNRAILPGVIPVKHLVTRQNGNFSYVMKILYHKEKFIGIVLLESGPRNVAIYDMLCLLLSRALYGNYLKENRVFSMGEKKALLHSSTFRNILKSENPSETNGSIITTGRILEYLTDHLGEKTNIPLMARELGLSESNLMIKTKKMTGCTVQTLHEMLKIERAKMLLSRNEISISEISEKIGFLNQSYFAKVFRKHTGVSPGQWIKKKQK